MEIKKTTNDKVFALSVVLVTILFIKGREINISKELTVVLINIFFSIEFCLIHDRYSIGMIKEILGKK